MKNQFKVGDEVKLTNVLPDIWGSWAEEECDKDKAYIVSRVYDAETGGPYIDMEGVFLTHKSCQFKLVKPQVLTIVLRRPVDRGSIEKFLMANGFNDGSLVKHRRVFSRTMHVHLEGRSKGDVTYNAKCTWERGTKEVIEHTNEFLSKIMWNYKRIKVIKTKPSVKQAINEISRYI